MTARQLLGRLEEVRSVGERTWKARCPIHTDTTPSLTVTEGDERKVFVHCDVGCAAEAIVEALGLTLSDLFGTAAPRTKRETIAAASLPPVADWLRTFRKIADAEITQMLARDTQLKQAVVFRYQDGSIGVGFAPVISLPDGAGSRLTPELLAPLAKFTEAVHLDDGSILCRRCWVGGVPRAGSG